jgi:20S proteasome alpha/beta subunit
MTLIFGARCTDGVVLVGDRFAKSGADSSLTANKIRKCGNIEFAVFAAAGEVTLIEGFLSRLPETVNRTQSWMNFQNAKNDRERKETFGEKQDAPQILRYEYSVENFKHDCVFLLQDMMRTYAYAFENGDCILQILIGVNTGQEAKLYYLDSVNCLPAEVLDSIFIGQGELVKIFHKCWSEAMTMTQCARLGTFAIKYVETAGLSESVGVGRGQAQIWVIPDGKQPTEVTGEVLNKLMNETNTKVNRLYSQLNSLFRS